MFDPTATSARERDEALLRRMTRNATGLMTRASLAAKTGELEQARILYQQVWDLLLPGDELRDSIQKELEKLKR